MALSIASESIDLNVGVEGGQRAFAVAYSDFNAVAPMTVSAYIDLNIGVENVSPLPFSAMYADFNVGIEAPDEREGLEYVEMHIGLEQKPRIGAEYSDYNIYIEPKKVTQKAIFIDFDVVTDEVPTPHIWFIKPQRGKEGLMFNIIGQGFGVDQAQFNGKVRLGAIEAQVTQWDVRPADKQLVMRGQGYLDAGGAAYNRFAWFSPRGYWSEQSWFGDTIPENSVVLHTGDIIEFDYKQLHADTILGDVPYFYNGNYDEVEIIPYFVKLVKPPGSTSDSSYTIDNKWWITNPNTNYAFMSHVPPHFTMMEDQNGVPMNRAPVLAQGETVHRRFTVPSNFNNILTVNWGMAISGGVAAADRPDRGAEFSNFVIRNPDGTAKYWVTADDGSAVNFRSGVVDLNSDSYMMAGARELNGNWTSAGLAYRPATAMIIDEGIATVEHEHIIALVPDDAVDGMVRVVLEDG